MGGVFQSGSVTPGHLASWTTDGVVQDAGVALTNFYGALVSQLLQVNFNAPNSDNPLEINLPAGYTQYRIKQIIISGATASLTTATCGVFTGAGGTGIAVVNGGTAITVSADTVDTVNNMQLLPIANQNTLALFDSILYFQVQTPQGAIARGNVSIFYEPLP